MTVSASDDKVAAWTSHQFIANKLLSFESLSMSGLRNVNSRLGGNLCQCQLSILPPLCMAGSRRNYVVDHPRSIFTLDTLPVHPVTIDTRLPPLFRLTEGGWSLGTRLAPIFRHRSRLAILYIGSWMGSGEGL